MKKILSTKVLEEQHIELGKTFGWHIDCMPFIGIQPVMSEDNMSIIKEKIDEPIVAIFTSQNSVELVKKLVPYNPPKWKVICISGATRHSVEYWLGSESILYSGRDASEIIPSLRLFMRDELVFFCGKQRLDTIPNKLKELGKKYSEVILYDTQLNDMSLSYDYDAYLFFSPSGVEAFFMSNTIPEDTLVVSIGDTTAHAIRSHYDGDIAISNQPNIVGIYQKINEHYAQAKK